MGITYLGIRYEVKSEAALLALLAFLKAQERDAA